MSQAAASPRRPAVARARLPRGLLLPLLTAMLLRFLRERGVQPWTELPLWLHEEDQDTDRVSIAHALAHGLRFRPLEDSARDTLAWEPSLTADTRPPSPALKPEREAELLAEWHRRG